jgi:hypothetical protein
MSNQQDSNQNNNFFRHVHRKAVYVEETKDITAAPQPQGGASPSRQNQPRLASNGMNSTAKKIIGIIIPILILVLSYVGTLRPLGKSQSLIGTLRTVASARSLSDFESLTAKTLDYWSPVGQEELVRNTANMVLSIIQENSDPKTIANTVDYIESYYKPIIDYGRGMSFEQNLYILGAINEAAFVKTSDPRYLQAAHKYYFNGLALGPDRPQFLYGAFDIYRIEGNVTGVINIAHQIMAQWPEDSRTAQALDQYLTQVQQNAASSTQKKK